MPEPSDVSVFRSAPLTEGAALRVDRRALATRFFVGLSPPPAAKRREAEEFHFRIPAHYHPRTPAGLLIWVSPMPQGAAPRLFEQLADELGFFLAGAENSGNDRQPADRLQLALDVTAHMMRNFHIDERRIYVSGLSGGGKISTILQACCPDIFRGCIPIVGTGWWRDVHITRDTAWPRLFGPPSAAVQKLLLTRRIAPVTGSEDFNHDPVLASVRQMNEDSMAVRLFDVQGMSHEMPSVETLRAALNWIDEPWRTARQAEQSLARDLMRRYDSMTAEEAPPADNARALLDRITRDAPWTDEAWRAIELLSRSP